MGWCLTSTLFLAFTNRFTWRNIAALLGLQVSAYGRSAQRDYFTRCLMTSRVSAFVQLGWKRIRVAECSGGSATSQAWIVAKKLRRGLDEDSPVVSYGDEILVSGNNHLCLACQRTLEKFVIRGIAFDDTQSSFWLDHGDKGQQFLFNQSLDFGFRELEFRVAENPQIFFQNVTRKKNGNDALLPERKNFRSGTREEE